MPGWAASQSAWDSLRTSFWFVPTLMGAGGAALTGLSLLLEAATTDRPEAVPWFVYVSAADNARDVTSTLLASMMTMASLVFSITMVVLTLAAGQFGPRLIRNFMGARPTQLVLGTFVMTIVHCLLSLSAIGWRESGEAQPYFTVTVAILLSLVSVGLLVLHLHVLARSIMSETVIARVAQELSDTLDTMGPIEPEQSDPDAALPDDFYERAAFFGPNATGYVRTIDFDGLVAAGHEADVLIGLTFRPGDFVIESGGVIGIYPEDRAREEMAEAAREAIVIGAHRTPVQDPDFSIRHLVEDRRPRTLARHQRPLHRHLRDRPALGLACPAVRPRPPRRGAARRNGAVRVLCPRPTYASLVSAAFDQIRQNGAAKPAVIIHLIQGVERLAPQVRNKEQKQALADQLETILETARRGIPDTGDRADVEARAETAREAVATGRLRHG
jgi:uncharacterized membrane protein